MHPTLHEPLMDPPPKNGRPDRRPVRWWQGLGRLVCAAILCLGAVRGAGAEARTLAAARIKAQFLFNFTKYVEWPKNAFASPTAPLVIALLGGQELAGPLRALVAGRDYRGHPIVVVDQVAADRATRCHILFLDAPRQGELPDLLSRLRGLPVLTVGASAGFTHRGGMINFGRRDDKVRLEINPAAAKAARLKLGVQLLGVADLVKPKP